MELFTEFSIPRKLVS